MDVDQEEPHIQSHSETPLQVTTGRCIESSDLDSVPHTEEVLTDEEGLEDVDVEIRKSRPPVFRRSKCGWSRPGPSPLRRSSVVELADGDSHITPSVSKLNIRSIERRRRVDAHDACSELTNRQYLKRCVHHSCLCPSRSFSEFKLVCIQAVYVSK